MPADAFPQRVRQTAWALVALAFASKLSFSFTGLVPATASYLIFQGGIHPYLNALLSLLLGAFLALQLRAARCFPAWNTFHPLYLGFVFGTLAILWIQHAIQLLNGIESQLFLVLATLGSTTALLLLFGLWVPAILGPARLLRGISLICLSICGVSIALYAMGAPGLWKGSRFIGVLKHIPYMVSCGSIGFLFSLDSWNGSSSPGKKLLFVSAQLCFLGCLYLTGTRSAFFAAFLGFGLFFLLYRSADARFRLGRILGVWLVLVAAALFGADLARYARDVATGKAALGQRAAQDGVGDRLEEVSRGLEMLERSPHFGLGLLSKFNSSESEEVVSSYNSFQDPHNLFISSAVVAGWPFGAWVLLGFLALSFASLRAIYLRRSPGLALGIYLLTHLPILAIYHMHLSLGGLADRTYWISFGLLALRSTMKKEAADEPKSKP